MPYDLTTPLVIAISSRALFNLEEENSIFEKDGLDAYTHYQLEHEKDIIPKGAAFPLVEAFLRLNELTKDRRVVEVIIVSRNSPDTSLRIFNAISEYGLDITRAALVGGADVTPYLRSFHTDLFLSAYGPDVKRAVDEGIAAGQILTGVAHSDAETRVDQIRIAFDGDAVLFNAEAERVFQHNGLEAFTRHEQDRAQVPLKKGPFANFLMTLSNIQALFPDRDQAPIRTALVTSRNARALERPLLTLRDWGVRVDEAFFLGGVSKKEVLASFGAHIFFDDQQVHADPASEVVPSALVPYRAGDNPAE